MDETVYESWEVNGDQNKINAIFILGALTISFLFTFYIIFLVSRSTNIAFLVIPIVLFFLTIGSLPEFLKSLNSNQQNIKVSMTELGIHIQEKGKEEVFLTWEQIAGYDMKYFISTSPLGKLFPKPTSFIFKTTGQESFRVDSFGEHVDVVRAYLKEKNIPFGFLQK